MYTDLYFLFSFLVNLGKLQWISLESSDGKADHVYDVVVSAPPGRLVPLLGKELGWPGIREILGNDTQWLKPKLAWWSNSMSALHWSGLLWSLTPRHHPWDPALAQLLWCRWPSCNSSGCLCSLVMLWILKKQFCYKLCTFQISIAFQTGCM